MKVLNMTDLYNKELVMYSFEDIKLKTPIRVATWGYRLLVFIIFSLPILLITGFSMNTFKTTIVLGVPFGLGTLMAKPIFNGRSFLAAMKVYAEYISSAKIYYDNKPSKGLPEFEIDEYVLISRRGDYDRLFNMKYWEKRGVAYE